MTKLGISCSIEKDEVWTKSGKNDDDWIMIGNNDDLTTMLGYDSFHQDLATPVSPPN